MKYLPLFLAAAEEYKYGTFAEKVALSGRFLLIGMGTVFFVLVLLWVVLAIFGSIANGANKKAATKAAPIPELPKTEEIPEPAAEVEEAPAAEDDGAVIAAICAAIEAYRAAEGKSSLPYRVVSFKRKSGKKSWNGPAED